MRNLIAVLAFLAFFVNSAQGQSTFIYDVSIPENIVANRTFPVVVTSRGECRYPYPETERPPDFVIGANQLDMTVYLRNFGANIVPRPPCVNRTQIYTAPALQSGTYQMTLASRLYSDLFNSFGPRIFPGSVSFVVAEAVPITQIPATSGWSLALLLLGIFGAARWASGVNGR